VSDNLGLAQLSDHLLIVAVVIYSLAMLAYAGDFAYGRRAKATASAETARPVPELAGVGVSGTASTPEPPSAVPEPGQPPAADPPVAADPAAGGRERLGPLIRGAIALTYLGLALHLAGVITRGLAVHRVPWGDMYEFVTALTCVTVLFFVALMMRYRAWHLGVFLTGAVVVALGLAQTVIYTPAGPLVPFVAAVLGVVYLFAERYSRRVAAGRSLPGHGIMRRLPAAEELDRLTYRTVVFGFPIWTFGIIAGAIWADQAWGRYWGWDPVETWAFITWVVYACFLHARATAGWRGKRAAYIQLTGFACLLFNVLVVQTFVTGLHSYAGLG
jgi:ABC-type transport system involved in cytochrome c biogenesis permease subunit